MRFASLHSVILIISTMFTVSYALPIGLPCKYSTTSRSKPEMPCIALGALMTRILRTPRSARIWAPIP